MRHTAITWEDIVAMNSRPASFMDTMGAVEHHSGPQTMEMEHANGHAVEAGAEKEAARAEGKPESVGAEEGEGEEEEPSNFHAEFMRAMRAEAEEAARQQARSKAELLEAADDHMDALVEEFPEAAEAGNKAESESDDDKPCVHDLLFLHLPLPSLTSLTFTCPHTYLHLPFLSVSHTTPPFTLHWPPFIFIFLSGYQPVLIIKLFFSLAHSRWGLA